MGIQDDISCKIQSGGNAYDIHSFAQTRYAYGTNPTTTFASNGSARGGVFKVSYRADLDNDVMSYDECLEYLTETKIFISRSHGEAFKNTTGVGEASGIILSNYDEENEASREGLYSHASSQIPVNGSYIGSYDYFDNLELAVFVGCETGYVDATEGNVGPGNNLPYLMVERGAEVAIGFQKTISCTDASTWTKKFVESLLRGKTVEKAVQEVLDSFEAESDIHSVVIYGNKNYTLYD